MHLLKKHTLFIFLILGTIGVTTLVNSCKKDNSDNVAYFLTYNKWQLASVTRQQFVGDTLKKTDTLNTTCNANQIFSFSNDNTCTYTNYHCLTQTSKGSWQLANDDLTLLTTLTAQDTLGGVIVAKPGAAFATSQIINLGQYSFVLQTGDTSPYYTSKTKRVIFRYGFVHSVAN